jgi:peptidoglycan/LPS O-acetylase OafA/YrhL
MTTATETNEEPRPLLSDEAGTAPGDRRFRPDIQGLRAVAVLLVVFYHAGVTWLSGGYVGVDVFFVISGFVITGLLLRERETSGRTSLVGFYGRRSRRIIPAATLVIVVTVVMTYARAGVVFGAQTATDARWAAVFLANFHFASIGTNYLTAQLPPSPLQNFWSLAVEEQFYLVYPTVFLLIASVRSRWSVHAKLFVGLVVIIAGSFALSVFQTASSPTVAYFSPLTRAWELAIGALVAVSTKWLLTLPKSVCAIVTWVGLAGIGFGAFVFNGNTAYPGSWVAIPVVGAAFVIAGGTRTPPWAAESVLKRGPFQWFGKLSYSIYLWHWPLLIIAADVAGTTSLPFRRNIIWLVVALAASVASFYLVENPLRHARLSRFGRWTPIGLGAMLIAVSLIVATVEIDGHAAPLPASSQGTKADIPRIAGSTAEVEQLVNASTNIKTLPADLTPALTNVTDDWGGPAGRCWASIGQSSIPACMFGDLNSTHTMVVYGDSHAAMWFQTLDFIAEQMHWRLAFLGKGYCPAGSLAYENPPGLGSPGSEYSVCDQWHRFALNRINALHPNLVIITQEVRGKPDGDAYTASQWQHGLVKTISLMHVPKDRIVVLGNIPLLPTSGPQCLSRQPDNVQACSGPVSPLLAPFNKAEEMAATEKGAHYVSVTPWFCSSTCAAVVGNYEVYWDRYHITAAYAFFLGGVLAESLPLPHARGFILVPRPTTTVLVPANGTTLSGRRPLDAIATGNVASVRFEVTGGTLRHHVISGSELTKAGWIVDWNTTTVPNGTYMLQSVATNIENASASSAAITITVDNPARKTAVSHPSDSATQSGISPELHRPSRVAATPAAVAEILPDP